MTIHKLTKPGTRKTACGLVVPGIIRLGANAETWDDGDTAASSLCVDGCYQHEHVPLQPHGSPDVSALNRFIASKAGVEPFDPAKVLEPRPSSPRLPGLQRFTVVSGKGTAQLKVGNAVVNRDGTISAYVGEMTLTLVPA